MSLLLGLAVLSTAVQGYSLYTSAEQAKEAAKLKKEDIALQRKSMELNEEARKFKEELAEAKVRKDLRRAQAIRLTRQAISGTDYSSTDVAIREGLTAMAEGDIAIQEELAGIASGQADIQGQRLSVAESMIQEPSTLDQILGYAGLGISAGLMFTQTPEYKKWSQPQWTTEYGELQSFDVNEYIGPDTSNIA